MFRKSLLKWSVLRVNCALIKSSATIPLRVTCCLWQFRETFPLRVTYYFVKSGETIALRVNCCLDKWPARMQKSSPQSLACCRKSFGEGDLFPIAKNSLWKVRSSGGLYVRGLAACSRWWWTTSHRSWCRRWCIFAGLGNLDGRVGSMVYLSYTFL